MTFFKGRKLVIASMHNKDQVIAPLLENELGVSCEVAPELNTDLLGTFSGEVERLLAPLDAAREKCKMAMQLSGCDLAIASEGSFGAHPTAFFLHANEELVLLVDQLHNIEVVGKKLTTQTNLAGQLFFSHDEVLPFAENAGFPSHGLILKNCEKGFSNVHKGVIDAIELHQLTDYYLTQFKQVWVETDMRACYNPTRMKTIEEATKDLLNSIANSCPSCSTPGLVVTAVKKGLPCKQCGLPTRSILSVTFSCQKCDFNEERKYPNKKEYEDPMYCDFCNP